MTSQLHSHRVDVHTAELMRAARRPTGAVTPPRRRARRAIRGSGAMLIVARLLATMSPSGGEANLA